MHFKLKDTDSLKRIEKIYHTNTRLKKPGVAILIAGKIDSRANKDDHFIMMKSIHQDDLTVLKFTHLKYRFTYKAKTDRL